MSTRYDGTLTPGVQGAPSRVVIQSRGHPGLLAGLFGCVLAILGIFTLGFVFVPLAALCALVGLLRGISGFNATGIGTSLLAACLCVFGLATSPVLLAVVAGLLVTNAVTRSAPDVIPQPQHQASPMPSAQDQLQWALNVTSQAAVECRAKRLRGELPSHAASVQCANPPMLQAFSAAHYRYMDLIQTLAEKRLELASKTDRGEMTEQEEQIELQRFNVDIQAIERRRDTAPR
jgi:uncharacterized iron-regulated membrane protein